MKIYYYCVTTESPVGYIPGSLLIEPQRATNYELQRSNIPTMIRRCFEQGLVLKAFGKLPSKSDYFLLVKKLTAKGNEDKGEAAAYGLALALETDDENEYRRWLNPDSVSERDIAEANKNTMAIDRHVNDFGFTVRPKPLNNLAKMSFRSLLEKSGISPKQDLAEETYFQLSSKETDFAELKEALKLEDPESNFEWLSPKSNGWVKYGKKKQGLRDLIKMWISAGITAIRKLASRAMNAIRSLPPLVKTILTILAVLALLATFCRAPKK